MAEYIKREAAIAYIREQSEECQKAFEELGGESGIYADAYNDLAEDFYSIPAADVAPVVHGRWVFGGDGCVICSKCNEEESNDNHRNYCPNCGAKMDGGESGSRLSDDLLSVAEIVGLENITVVDNTHHYVLPTVDAVVVTRCKNCAHSTLPSELTQRYGKPGTLTCHNRHSPCNRRNVGENDFCSYGKPKEV